MPFRICKNEPINEAIRRIALEQIDEAIREANCQELSESKRVHQIRKRCKKLRGLVRLARAPLKNLYKPENAWFRDTAKPLSAVRDSKTLLDACDHLMDYFDDQVERSACAPIRRHFEQQHRHLLDERCDVDEQIAAAAQRMQTARERVESWPLSKAGFKTIEVGLRNTYDKARTGMQHALEAATIDAFHEWRKPVKYHHYHCRILHAAWPAEMKVRQDQSEQLGELLGTDHDLAILRTRVADSLDNLGDQNDVDAFVGLIEQRRHRIEQQAYQLGRRLFAEDSRAFSKRIQRYWKSIRMLR